MTRLVAPLRAAEEELTRRWIAATDADDPDVDVLDALMGVAHHTARAADALSPAVRAEATLRLLSDAVLARAEAVAAVPVGERAPGLARLEDVARLVVELTEALGRLSQSAVCAASSDGPDEAVPVEQARQVQLLAEALAVWAGDLAVRAEAAERGR